MSSFSAEYTTKRTDHANWEQPSRRRGTYFGMYAAPKEAIANTTPSKSSGGEGRRLANDSSAPPSASASTNRSRPRGGGEDTHSRTQRFLSRVSKKRISGKFSSDEIALFRRKNAELEEHLDSLQKNFDELEREHFIVQGEYQISQGNVEELNATIKSMEEENKRLSGLLILEKARAQNAAEKTQAVEKKFQEEFEQYKELSGKTIHSLEASLEASNDRLAAAERQLREMFQLKEENQRRKEECKRMKQSLVKAKAYTLHKALNATVAASKSQSIKMQRIIAHLQAEHAALNTALEEVIAERNVLREELDNQADNNASESQEALPPPTRGDDGAQTTELAVVEERMGSLKQKLDECLADRDALAAYARHLEERLGVVEGSSTNASPSRVSDQARTTHSPPAQQQPHHQSIHISKRGSVHITRE